MRIRRLLGPIVVSLAACGSVRSYDSPDAGPGADGPAIDSPVTPTGRCDRSLPFSTPTGFDQFDPGGARTMSLTADELTAVVASAAGQLMASHRATLQSDFPLPSSQLFANVNSGSTVFDAPSITGNGRGVYFRSEDGFLLYTSRLSSTALFSGGAVVSVDAVNLLPGSFKISADGKTLHWVGRDDGILYGATGVDALSFHTVRAASTMTVSDVVIGADALTLYYYADGEILVSTRATTSVPFEPGAPLAELNTAGTEVPLAITADGCEIYVRSDRPGHAGLGDVWRARRGSRR